MKKKNDEKEIFAKGVCFKKIFIIFIIGCIFGTYYEMILNLVRHYLNDGTIFWETRSGLLYGPFSPVYGLGAAIMSYFLADKNYKWWQILLYGAILGGVVEYLLSFLQETFTGTISWNYNDDFLNINGRTTIPLMFLWGFICLVFIKILYPFLSNLIEKIPVHYGNIIFNIVLVLLIIDMLLSFTAVIRQALRRNDYPAYTFIGEFCDKVYTDERLKKSYPNMVISK